MDGQHHVEAKSVVVGLSDLPDELLLAVLARLDLEGHAVLGLRRVCRRWCALLVEADVWRGRDVRGERLPSAVTAAILSHAPCLDSLSLDLQGGGVGSVGSILEDTKCAVRELELHAWLTDLDVCTLAVRRQVELGRLRAVVLRDVLSDAHAFMVAFMQLASLDSILNFAQALCQADGLETIYLSSLVDSSPPDGDAELLRSLADDVIGRPASLLHFRTVSWLPEAAVDAILRRHAPTLRTVDLLKMTPDARVPVAARLSEAAHLQQLLCRVEPDLPLLLRCRELRVLALDVSGVASTSGPEGRGKVLAGARAFFAGAAHLEAVALLLDGVEEDEAAKSLVEEALAGLAAGECARLKDFGAFSTLLEADFGPAPTALAGALAFLPRLETLHLSFGPTAAFLEAITAESAPELRVLRVSLKSISEELGGCSHAWLHSEPVLGLLRRVRRLHLQFQATPAGCGSASCAPCSSKCHFDLDADDGGDVEQCLITVFAHDPDDGEVACGVEHLQGRHWCRLDG